MSKVAATAAATVPPVIWTFLGYQFEGASMIAGLGSCLMVRIWVSLNDKSVRAWTVDIAVMGLTLLCTASWIIEQRPTPFYALLSGTGFGALGAGIITVALKYLRKFGLTDNDGSGVGPTPPDMGAKLHEIDKPK
ncbi:hypothetical protein [Sphingomonas montana]|uniref:hypothetical protein n=1 Tax=Sphingomonas montana TaxID=1843236 RepID=UPI00096BF231|nr:hypothetical protein [Sphingomonas montana]